MDKKASFTEEEKQLILNKLNRKRIKIQKIEEPIKKQMLQKELERLKAEKSPQEESRGYTKDEKDKIFARINRDRVQKRDTQKGNVNKLYKVYGKDYYKFIDMPRSYYLRTDMMAKLSPKPIKVYLYYLFLGELKKKEMMIRKVSYTQNLLVSMSTTKLNFKEHRLELEEPIRG